MRIIIRLYMIITRANGNSSFSVRFLSAIIIIIILLDSRYDQFTGIIYTIRTRNTCYNIIVIIIHSPPKDVYNITKIRFRSAYIIYC